jgi:hypothetical protein
LDDEASRCFASIALLSLDQPQVGIRGRWRRRGFSPQLQSVLNTGLPEEGQG